MRPGQRYHPAVIAQAAATTGRDVSQRFWMAIGSGQLLNEILPVRAGRTKPTRQARLLECVTIIRALVDGERSRMTVWLHP